MNVYTVVKLVNFRDTVVQASSDLESNELIHAMDWYPTLETSF